ncbi:hypothetical protein L1887_42493 [Cichorium endivia]|nr:hypothetical protein L1887_42493 [Cichorium endivia]
MSLGDLVVHLGGGEIDGRSLLLLLARLLDHARSRQTGLVGRVGHDGALVLSGLGLLLDEVEFGGSHGLEHTNDVAVGVLEHLLALVGILTDVGRLVLEVLEQLVESGGDNGGRVGCDPVDPVVALEGAQHHIGAERTRRVERATRVVGAQKLSDEQGQTDTHGCEERSAVLLCSQQEDDEDELCGEEEFKPEALRDGGTVGERGPGVEGAGKDALDESRGGDSTGDLSNGKVDQLEPAERSSKEKRQGDGRVEETARHTVEGPGVDGEGETETKRREEERRGVRGRILRERGDCTVVLARGTRVGSLGGNTECKEEEEHSADELGNEGDDVVLDLETTTQGGAVVVAVLVLLFVDLHKVRQLLLDDDALAALEQSRLLGRLAVNRARAEREDGRLCNHLTRVAIAGGDGRAGGRHSKAAVLVVCRLHLVRGAVAYSRGGGRTGLGVALVRLFFGSVVVHARTSGGQLRVGCRKWEAATSACESTRDLFLLIALTEVGGWRDLLTVLGGSHLESCSATLVPGGISDLETATEGVDSGRRLKRCPGRACLREAGEIGGCPTERAWAIDGRAGRADWPWRPLAIKALSRRKKLAVSRLRTRGRASGNENVPAVLDACLWLGDRCGPTDHLRAGGFLCLAAASVCSAHGAAVQTPKLD